jgi:protein-S-isoprenylcysteine O-methyltransferase Ste14
MISTAEKWVRRFGVMAGLAAILVPVISYRRADRQPRGRKTPGVAPRLTWPQMAGVTAVYFGGGFLLWRPIPLWLSRRQRLASLLAGSLLYFLGVGLYLWGYTSLGRWFSPSSSRGAELYSDHQLITTGPHAIVRHPMYLGVLLAAFGALLIFKTWAMIPYALSSLVVIARAKREEQLLVEEFGEAWTHYCERVPGWLRFRGFRGPNG